MPKNTLPPMAQWARSIQNSSALRPPNTGQIKKIRGFRGVTSGDHPGRPGGGRYGQSLTPKRSHSPVMSSKHCPLSVPGAVISLPRRRCSTVRQRPNCVSGLVLTAWAYDNGSLVADPTFFRSSLVQLAFYDLVPCREVQV
ncbi:hypothetical protein M431DRAFT_507786 [Trichoderma harzianum CBS 226.95]|uniref:Uncharacterized protein n=1 Tax=Trichoderma harzianum CBS 226.95 TaxID=983964 RepID=A0A2T4AGC3_TRIHA|nr:hypothetical protein M431DRAFT_507786 [Trichoderma harzianum CBS 226.95]PTB56141.1 hypothetical protein M431DRAFT_507786 [Trichoderma harzianum CBS 226.95]